MLTFQESLAYLYSFVSYERQASWHYSNKTLNLERFRGFLALLGDPQHAVPAIHVAGSDGKGSVCAMLASVLQAMGYKVGLYTSPHLQNIRERIRIDGDWISEADFARWTTYLQENTRRYTPPPEGYATFFELMTAMAFLHFQHKQADFMVIETGLGGRLDATNVMRPRVTVITHISLEHTEQLGNTLEAIADEKLGITRPAVPAVIGSQDADLYAHFEKRLHNHSAPVVYAGRQYRAGSEKRGARYRTLEVESPPGRRRIVQIPLFGQYQIENTLTALAALDTLVQHRVIPPISTQVLRKGFRNAYWPGRFEILRRPGKSPLVLDVAHTTNGAASLRRSLDEFYPSRKRIFVLGFLQDKRIGEMVQHLVRPQDRLIITQAPSPRAASLGQILHELDGLPDIAAACLPRPEPRAALDLAVQLGTKNDVICVAGSLYLVGEIRSFLLSGNEKKPASPEVTSDVSGG
ncbi:MAG: folylpolyglutamate synthase/dihydrofolate synthase family protein [bacterium]